MTAGRLATGKLDASAPAFFLAELTGPRSLPFINDPDVAMGIAVKTLLDEVPASEPAKERAQRKKDFPARYVPYATHFEEDLDIAVKFFGALHAAVKSLDKEVSAADKAVWDRASKWLEARL